MSADIRHATHTGRGLLHSRTALMFFSICISVVYLRPLLKSNCISGSHSRKLLWADAYVFYSLFICCIVSNFFYAFYFLASGVFSVCICYVLPSGVIVIIIIIKFTPPRNHHRPHLSHRFIIIELRPYCDFLWQATGRSHSRAMTRRRFQMTTR